MDGEFRNYKHYDDLQCGQILYLVPRCQTNVRFKLIITYWTTAGAVLCNLTPDCQLKTVSQVLDISQRDTATLTHKISGEEYQIVQLISRHGSHSDSVQATVLQDYHAAQDQSDLSLPSNTEV